MKCFIQLSGPKEQVSLLPILQHELETTGIKPTLMVASDCTAVALAQTFATPFIFPGPPGDLLGAVTLAKKLWSEVISCHTQKPINNFPPHPNWQFDQWDRCGKLHLWNKLPLTFPKLPLTDTSAAIIHGTKPFILYADTDSDFQHKEELFRALEDTFPSHQIVRLSETKTFHLFDEMALYDAAELIVCLDNLHLQLARATKTPVMALAQDGWQGAAPIRRFAWFGRYKDYANL